MTHPLFIREAFNNLEALVDDSVADYVILRNGCDQDGADAQVASFGEPWARRADIRAAMESHWGGCFDTWAVTATAEVLPHFGRCLVLAFVGTHPDHPSLDTTRTGHTVKNLPTLTPGPLTALATSANAAEYRDTDEKFIYCLGLLGMSASHPATDATINTINHLEDLFDFINEQGPAKPGGNS